MASMPMTLTRRVRDRSHVTVQFDTESLERLAAACGWFHPDFEASIARAEKDIRAGRMKRLRSFKDLRA